MKAMTIAVRTTIVTLALTGLVYPFVMTGLAQMLFPWRANGSLVTDEKGQVVGSELIAQGFVNPAYFQPRPSAAGEKGYDATSSSGSNLGPTSKKLQDRIKDDLKRLKEENPDAAGSVPAELVTTSGSGLDPDLSPAAMFWQVPRVAKARGVTTERVKAVVDSNIEGRTFGVLGEPRVNVLLVNLALDRQFGRPAPPSVQEKKNDQDQGKI
jgi:K+-transporting ATPase ATPase C chain